MSSLIGLLTLFFYIYRHSEKSGRNEKILRNHLIHSSHLQMVKEDWRGNLWSHIWDKNPLFLTSNAMLFRYNAFGGTYYRYSRSNVLNTGCLNLYL